MWAPVVVKAYPVANDTAGMLYGFEAVPMGTLFFKRPDNTLDHAILLWAMGRNELLTKAIAAHQCGIAARGKHKPIV